MPAPRRALALAAALCLFAPLPARAAPPPAVGFERPESAHWHRGAWYVSNTDGRYVSKLDAEGGVLELRWLDNLHGPFGLAAHGRLLFVSDTDRVVVADLRTGAIRRIVPFPDASLLNDVAVDRRGNAYVSDTCAGDIHRIRKGRARAQALISLPGEGPNGLAVRGKRLFVAGLGAIPGVCGDPTALGGRLLSVHLKTGKVTPISDRLGALDGLEPDGARFLVTDFATGRLLAVDAETGEASLVATGPPSAADLGFDPDRRIVAIPHSFANAVVFHDV